MYWDKRGILKIYNFCRRGRRNSPHFVRHISQGRFSFQKRTAPARPQENARGCRPLTPELRRSNYRSATVCECIGAAQPRFLPLSIWSASMSAQPLLRRGYGDVLFRRFWVNLHGYIKFALRRQRLAGRLLIPLTGCRIRGIHFLSAPRNTMPIIKCHIPPRRYHIVLPKKFAVPTVHARFSVFP